MVPQPRPATAVQDTLRHFLHKALVASDTAAVAIEGPHTCGLAIGDWVAGLAAAPAPVGCAAVQRLLENT